MQNATQEGPYKIIGETLKRYPNHLLKNGSYSTIFDLIINEDCAYPAVYIYLKIYNILPFIKRFFERMATYHVSNINTGDCSDWILDRIRFQTSWSLPDDSCFNSTQLFQFFGNGPNQRRFLQRSFQSKVIKILLYIYMFLWLYIDTFNFSVT